MRVQQTNYRLNLIRANIVKYKKKTKNDRVAQRKPRASFLLPPIPPLYPSLANPKLFLPLSSCGEINVTLCRARRPNPVSSLADITYMVA